MGADTVVPHRMCRRRRGFMKMGLLLGGVLIASLGIVPLYRFCCGRSKRKLHTSRLKSRCAVIEPSDIDS